MAAYCCWNETCWKKHCKRTRVFVSYDQEVPLDEKIGVLKPYMRREKSAVTLIMVDTLATPTLHTYAFQHTSFQKTCSNQCIYIFFEGCTIKTKKAIQVGEANRIHVSTHSNPLDNSDQSRLCVWLLGTIAPLATLQLEQIAEELTEVTGQELSRGLWPQGQHSRVYPQIDGMPVLACTLACQHASIPSCGMLACWHAGMLVDGQPVRKGAKNTGLAMLLGCNPAC